MSHEENRLPDRGQLPHSTSRRVVVGWWLGAAFGLFAVLFFERERLRDAVTGANPQWLADFNIDATPFLFLFLLLPVCWWVRQPLLSRTPRWFLRLRNWLAMTSDESGRSGLLIVLLIVGMVATGAAWRVAETRVGPGGEFSFGDLPPAFHDEFSYRFQARTFVGGHWSHPSHPTAPRLFDQMHVLNEGRFVSRYFPGTGAWFAPFLLAGDIRWGPLAAMVFTCLCIAAIGRELGTNGTGLLAGSLCAVAPGMDLFANTLLSHQPTLAGLGLFLLAFVHWQQRLIKCEGGTLSLALLSGTGLSFAMLCRPMTAAGIGLPFGLWIGGWLIRHRQQRAAVARIVIGFGIPLLVGFAVMLIHNAQTTGRPLKTPYGLYTELFTPRHQFGFNNVVRAEQHPGPRVLDHYDRWALNLDASLAAKNVFFRLLASLQWTLGVIVLVWSILLVLSGLKQLDPRWKLILAAIVSLHLVHVPYWFDGILHWHYVFETGPLWCLVASAATLLVVRLARQWDRVWIGVWWYGLLLVSVTVNQIALPPFWGTSRLEAGIHEFAFSRLRYASFQQLIEHQVTQRPALVLIRHDPDDRHIDYVDNPPDLSADVLTARLPMDAQSDEEATLRAVRAAFPDRRMFVFDAKSGTLQAIR